MSAFQQEIVGRLQRDFELREQGDWLRKGRCPECGKRELYTRADQPRVLRCGRLNKCGWEERIRDLYPDLFAQFNQRHKPTEEDPNATARAYLRYARGIDPDQITGWFEQGRWWHPDADKGTATVRFHVDRQAGIYMERFVEPVTVLEDGERVQRRAHFQGKHKGMAWWPPGQSIEPGDEVWITEGVLDAICLALSGRKVLAILSCVNYPTQVLETISGKDRITWVWALDNDRAGRESIVKHAKRMREDGLPVAAALIPRRGRRSVDWNDLHQDGRLDQATISECRYHGDLLLARTPTEKAVRMYQRTERQEFPLEHGCRMYWWKLDLDKYQKEYEGLAQLGEDEATTREKALSNAGAVVEIANCSFRFLYFQHHALTDESWYYCRIEFPHSGKAVKGAFTSGQISSVSEFKKRLLGVGPGAVFTGTPTQLDRIVKDQLYGVKTVQTVDFIGYSKEHEAYVYPEIAVRGGRVYELNDEDYFDTGKLSIKTLSSNVPLHIERARDRYQTDWVQQLQTAFGTDGLIALTFWFGSLFAEQIRDTHKSYPFLEVVGDPGAGKSTLLEFLWRLAGRNDYEGFDPSKSTNVGRARNFAQVSNLPVVLIEGDRDDEAKGRGFDWDELKTAYNGRSVRARGVRTGGNETYEPPFRGAIVISQNADVVASEAVLQRIVHLRFSQAGHDQETKQAAEALERTPVEEVSHFLIEAVTRESQVLDFVLSRTPRYEAKLLDHPELRSARIAKNHAQLMALADALARVVPLPKGAVAAIQERLQQLAVARQKAVNADPPLVQEFWELYEWLGGDEDLNHARSPGYIAINLNQITEKAMQRKQNIPPMQDLKRALKAGKTRKFVECKAVNSRLSDTDYGAPRVVKCWVFREAGQQ